MWKGTSEIRWRRDIEIDSSFLRFSFLYSVRGKFVFTCVLLSKEVFFFYERYLMMFDLKITIDESGL